MIIQLLFVFLTPIIQADAVWKYSVSRVTQFGRDGEAPRAWLKLDISSSATLSRSRGRSLGDGLQARGLCGIRCRTGAADSLHICGARRSRAEVVRWPSVDQTAQIRHEEGVLNVSQSAQRTNFWICKGVRHRILKYGRDRGKTYRQGREDRPPPTRTRPPGDTRGAWWWCGCAEGPC